MQTSLVRSAAPSSRRAAAAGAASAGGTPRHQRTSRKTILAHLPTDTPHDLIGPPDPLTNLRPIYYAPRFVEPSSSVPGSPGRPVAKNRKVHPYSLDEFSTSTNVSSSAADGLRGLPVLQDGRPTQRRTHTKLMQLEQLRARFEAEDLAWRLRKRRLQRTSHEHWARSNYAFHTEKQQAVARAQAEGSCEFEALEKFHQDWVNAGHGQAFARYQSEWLAGLFGQLIPDLKAIYRDYRWKLELWRCGLPYKHAG